MLLNVLGRCTGRLAGQSLLRIPRNPPNSCVARLIGSNRNADAARRHKIRTTIYYVAAAGVLTVGMSYAAVPLYRMFCQAYSYGGTTGVGHDAEKVESMKLVQDRVIKILFNADIGASMRWNFKPQQPEIRVCFCFEEQQLNPHEEVDMPVFFYIDPEIMDDPKMELVDSITLSYTFFEAKEGVNFQMPVYATKHGSK
ncbi:hypothetical protein pipiens_013225 [Culex pipiens pipiens]|uniref:Cytochrome c oxidase assembly protein COX11, mitochondrial n=1 Tax=Culex pipiens pipiens TaxID=38569 RepID=A0ABD1CZH2_CULPP